MDPHPSPNQPVTSTIVIEAPGSPSAMIPVRHDLSPTGLAAVTTELAAAESAAGPSGRVSVIPGWLGRPAPGEA
jgi:hypothetical protein